MQMKKEIRSIPGPGDTKLDLIILRPEEQVTPLPGILWIHGGGHMLGSARLVSGTNGAMLAKKYGAVLISPEYRLAGRAPFPADLEDCYAALLYMYARAKELGIRRDKIVVGGESAGGGLTAALCLLARDMGDVDIALQLPLYPMLDCDDTPSSIDNHGWVWNTKRNHWAWSHYLGDLYGSDQVPAYASPSKANDLSGLPTCYTFVGDGEPFYCETLDYVKRLQEAGVEATIDVFPTSVHAFERFTFWKPEAKMAKEHLCQAYERYIGYSEDYGEDSDKGPAENQGESCGELI